MALVATAQEVTGGRPVKSDSAGTASRAPRTRTTRRSRRRSPPSAGGSAAPPSSWPSSSWRSSRSGRPVAPRRHRRTRQRARLPGRLPAREAGDGRPDRTSERRPGARRPAVLPRARLPLGPAEGGDPGAVRQRRPDPERARRGGNYATRTASGWPRCWSASCRPATASSPPSRAPRSWSAASWARSTATTRSKRRQGQPGDHDRRPRGLGRGVAAHLRHPRPQDQGRAADRGDHLGRGPIGALLRLDPGHPFPSWCPSPAT